MSNKNSRFSDEGTFAPRVVSQGDGSKPLGEDTPQDTSQEDTTE